MLGINLLEALYDLATVEKWNQANKDLSYSLSDRLLCVDKSDVTWLPFITAQPSVCWRMS